MWFGGVLPDPNPAYASVSGEAERRMKVHTHPGESKTLTPACRVAS